MFPCVFDPGKKKNKTVTSRYYTSVFRQGFSQLLLLLVFHTHPLRAPCERQPGWEPTIQAWPVRVWADTLVFYLCLVCGAPACVYTETPVAMKRMRFTPHSLTPVSRCVESSQSSFRLQQRGICWRSRLDPCSLLELWRGADTWP